METIKDIVAEMRDAGGYEFEYFADRIEKAVTNCNQLKMREALKCIDNIAKYLECGTIRDVLHAYRNIQDRVRIALSTPPRNCDRFNAPDEALSVYCENEGITQPLPIWYGNEYWGLLQWLFAEAKGDNKWD